MFLAPPSPYAALRILYWGSRISQRGTNPRIWGKNLLFKKIFAKNYKKMKEIGPSGACVRRPTPFVPPMKRF